MGEGEQADAGSPDTRTKHSDAVGISTKKANVLADPPQSLDLVQEPIVSFSSLVTRTEEACNTKHKNGHKNMKSNTTLTTAVLDDSRTIMIY